MSVIVCKFGGTSTADAEMFKRIHAIIKEDPRRRYAVLSAPGKINGGEKVTDLLYAAWRTRSPEAAVGRFEAIARELGVNMDFRTSIERALKRSEAETVSRGEYLCAKLFSKWSGIPFADAAELIFFDEGGKIDRDRTLRAIREMSKRLERAVIPGFYGSGPGGEIVTFPRNGSDITGALLAAGVGASLYENWTDVPGLMTGDPAADPGAKLIDAIRCDELRRMPGNPRVLHPDSLDAVQAAGIPTRIRCTMTPELPGTLVY